jgi:AmiR/NasT family two-component response regulator
LQSREVIGEAKGIIMERHQVTAEQAFEMLREASLRQSVGIRELAEALVSTRTLG